MVLVIGEYKMYYIRQGLRQMPQNKYSITPIYSNIYSKGPSVTLDSSIFKKHRSTLKLETTIS